MTSERILIVEDDEDVIEFVSDLVQAVDFEVFVAKNGPECLKLAKELLPTLILLDIRIPLMDGFEICPKLRDNFSTSHIPIVVLSGVCKDIEDKVKGLDLGADDYITKPFDGKELIARIKAILRRTHLERGCNPLTELPGNIAIEQQIKSRLNLNETFTVLYSDLDNFKPFNDYYGYNKGDQVIKSLSRIFIEAVENLGNSNDFVGHIGGDDFILITTPDKSKPIADRVIDRLASLSEGLFDKEALKRGYFEITDRRGEVSRFPATIGITIAAVTSAPDNQLRSHLKISDSLAEVKHYGKNQPGSVFVVDRRGGR
ncbi:MAG: response regulator [bacterium]